MPETNNKSKKIRKEKPLSILDPVMPAMYCAITKKERVNDQATSTEGGAAPAARKGDGGQKEMTAIEALEKQVPIKPLPQEMDIDGRAITPCGFCGEELPHNSLYDFCPYCGQAIDRRKDG